MNRDHCRRVMKVTAAVVLLLMIYRGVSSHAFGGLRPLDPAESADQFLPAIPRPEAPGSWPLDGRNIFARAAAPVIEVPKVASAPRSLTVASLKLKGILFDERPQAILEDATSGELRTVAEGDEIVGGRVKQIGIATVVLEEEGVDLILTMNPEL